MATSTLGPDLVTAAGGLQDHTVELRRAIHADPELGLDLPNTQQKITDALTGLGYDIALGESTTSVVADLHVERDGPTTLLRADMDALPMPEDIEVPWKSQNQGRMHACGHDSHVAMLVSAARMIADNKDQLPGSVRLMFQPGEEGHHGARYMIDEGVLDGVDRAFAIHVITPMPSGMFFSKGGPLMASADKFDITIIGRGGHASMPADAIDPIPAAAQTILGLHTMVGRIKAGSDPAVLTVAHMEAGTTNNVIPETAHLLGTLRSTSAAARHLAHRALRRIPVQIAAADELEAEVEIEDGYPVTVNDRTFFSFARSVANDLVGATQVHEMRAPVMGAEDFSYLLERWPGAMVFLGVRPRGSEPPAPCHSNRMLLNEAGIETGIALHAAIAARYLDANS